MDQRMSFVGPICFAAVAMAFGGLAVVYGNAWAQTMAQSALTAAAVAFQIPSAKA